MNIDQNNPYPVYLGIGLVAASLGYCLFNRMVTYCRKEKAQAKDNFQNLERPDSTLSDRELQSQNTVDLEPKSPLQVTLKTHVSLLEGNNYMQAISIIGLIIENEQIDDSETAIFLANLLKRQLIKIKQTISKSHCSPVQEQQMKEVHHHILGSLLKKLIQLDKIDDNQILSDLGIFLTEIFNDTSDVEKYAIFQILQPIVKHKLDDNALSKIKALSVDTLQDLYNNRTTHYNRIKYCFIKDTLADMFANNETFDRALPEQERNQIKAFYT